MDPLRIIDRAMPSSSTLEAGVTAFLTALLVQYRLGVAPAVLRLDATSGAGLLGGLCNVQR